MAVSVTSSRTPIKASNPASNGFSKPLRRRVRVRVRVRARGLREGFVGELARG